MSIDTRIGIAGLILALFSIAAFYLWPDKKWIGWFCISVGAILLGGWIALEIKQRFGNQTLFTLEMSALALALILAIISRWNDIVNAQSLISVSRVVFGLAFIAAVFLVTGLLTRQSSSTLSPGFPFNPNATLIEVRDRTFRNERVLLDGHRYTDCIFENVTLVYNGTALVDFTQ
jgi:hypothetical protein